jgi:predicted amidohydrolase YtcJ
MTDRPNSVRLINARIYRDVDDRVPADTLVTRGGAIDFVGARDDAPPADLTIDTGGAAVMPGLTDPHIHLFAIATERLQIALDSSSVRSVASLQERVSANARRTGNRQWLRGVGFDENALSELRYPTLAELDAVAPDHPLVIRRFCGHTALLNSAALSALSIDDGVSDPVGGSFGRDHAGRLNGIAKESAAEAVFRAIPSIDRALVAGSLRTTIADAMGLGLTAAVEAAVGFTSGFDEEQAVWESLRRDRSLMRLGFMYQLDPKEALARNLTPARSPDWQTNSLKFFADGIVGARTAAVSSSFRDSGGYGFFMRDEGELERVILEAHLAGWQVAVHAVGDRAISRVIGAFERAYKIQPTPDIRHRIEHYFCPPPAGLQRMKDVGAMVVSQPSFVSRMHRSIIHAFGEDAATKYPARSVLEAGVSFAASSDAPTGDFSPWAGASAMDRGIDKGVPIGPSEALTRRQAIGSYVFGGAYAMKQERWRGAIQPGLVADLIVLDQDPFDTKVNLRTVKVLMTMLRGVIVHDVTGSRVRSFAGLTQS